MTVTLRILLLITALSTAFYILIKIKNNKVKMEDAIFWIFFAVILSILGLLPELSYLMAGILGIQSPANFVFLFFIFILSEKIFTMSIKLSQLEDKLSVLSAEVALRTAQKREDK